MSYYVFLITLSVIVDMTAKTKHKTDVKV